MKFRVHVFEEVRRTYETEAESLEAAYSQVDDLIMHHEPVESERTGDYVQHVLVDALLPDGSVDYENTKWFPEEE